MERKQFRPSFYATIGRLGTERRLPCVLWRFGKVIIRAAAVSVHVSGVFRGKPISADRMGRVAGQEPAGRTDDVVLKCNKSVSPAQVLGMLHWALIASTPYVHAAAYGWVMFVAVTLWILTTVLFFLTLFGIHRNSSVPWLLMVGEPRNVPNGPAIFQRTSELPADSLFCRCAPAARGIL